MQFTSKLPHEQPSIFAIMSQLASEQQAINLSQGFPDFPVNPQLKKLFVEALKDGHNQYAHPHGLPELRVAVSKMILECYDYDYDIDQEITVTAGATQAIYGIIAAFISEGDEVIILTPAYDCYAPTVKLHGGKVVPVQMNTDDFSVDWERVGDVVTDKTKMIITNSPHNPSGRVFNEEDMLALQQIVVENDLLHLSDEVYKHIVFDNKLHRSASSYPELAKRSFVTGSFGKTFHVTGWKVGYCLAPAELMAEFRKVHQNMVFCVNHPAQRAIAKYLQEPENYNQLGKFYQRKRDFFLSLIEDSKFKFVPSNGTYYQLLDYSEISMEDDVAFAKAMTRNQKLASIPISVFMNGCDPKKLRLCFAKEGQLITKAAEILNRF